MAHDPTERCSDEEALAYIEAMLRELRDLADEAGLRGMSYFLGMAWQAACEAQNRSAVPRA